MNDDDDDDDDDDDNGGVGVNFWSKSYSKRPDFHGEGSAISGTYPHIRHIRDILKGEKIPVTYWNQLILSRSPLLICNCIILDPQDQPMISLRLY